MPKHKPRVPMVDDAGTTFFPEQCKNGETWTVMTPSMRVGVNADANFLLALCHLAKPPEHFIDAIIGKKARKDWVRAAGRRVEVGRVHSQEENAGLLREITRRVKSGTDVSDAEMGRQLALQPAFRRFLSLRDPYDDLAAERAMVQRIRRVRAQIQKEKPGTRQRTDPRPPKSR